MRERILLVKLSPLLETPQIHRSHEHYCCWILCFRRLHRIHPQSVQNRKIAREFASRAKNSLFLSYENSASRLSGGDNPCSAPPHRPAPSSLHGAAERRPAKLAGVTGRPQTAVFRKGDIRKLSNCPFSPPKPVVQVQKTLDKVPFLDDSLFF
jgi:hypothetical protein